MGTYFLFLFSCCFYPFVFCMEVEEGLASVALIYRHGDRTPIKTYPTDPYSNSTFWPDGFGQLTNIGKVQLYQLGQWYRSRYKNFLSDHYSKKEVYILSTNVDRTLMSAQVNLAGLFPPQDEQIWNKNLNWQPIPIHTVPEIDDNILRMKMPCEKYRYLYDQLLKSQQFVDIDKKNYELYAYLTKHSGMPIKDIREVKNLYTTLTIERMYNYTLPKWTEYVFPDKMAPWAHLAFAVKCYTPELARLRAGPLLNHIFENFLKVTNRNGFKFVAYSAHDTTIANILTSLNMFDYHSPPYGATIFFELRYLNNSYFINMLYKNTSVPQKITLNGCEYLCPIDKFNKILKPLLITPQQWKEECVLTKSILSYAALSCTTFFIFFIMLLFAGFCIFTCVKNKKSRHSYVQLLK